MTKVFTNAELITTYTALQSISDPMKLIQSLQCGKGTSKVCSTQKCPMNEYGMKQFAEHTANIVGVLINMGILTGVKSGAITPIMKKSLNAFKCLFIQWLINMWSAYLSCWYFAWAIGQATQYVKWFDDNWPLICFCE